MKRTGGVGQAALASTYPTNQSCLCTCVPTANDAVHDAVHDAAGGFGS